jgi:hypothetical protein
MLIGGDHPARPIFGRHAAPLPAPPGNRSAGLVAFLLGPGARADARRSAVSGTVVKNGNDRGQFHGRRSRGTAPRDGIQALRTAHAAIESKLRLGMAQNAIALDVQDRIVQAITSFALYGFPESHAASFGLIAYASAYLKCHYWRPLQLAYSTISRWTFIRRRHS